MSFFVVEEDNIVSAFESVRAFGQFTANTTFAKPADFYLMLFGYEETISWKQYFSWISTFGSKGWSRERRGIAYSAMDCVKGWNVGIREDEPPLYYAFTKISHEIGHLLGSTHDGNGPLKNLRNHPGAVDCKLPEKYIMKPQGPLGPPFAFSHCSELQMQFVLKLRGEQCWRTESDCDFFNVTKEVAGRFFTAERFCQNINPELYTWASMKNCVITCRDSVSGMYATVDTYFAPFGYPCGKNGQGCWFGNCTNIDRELS